MLRDIDHFAEAIHMTLNGPVNILNRMRLACTPLSVDDDILSCARTGTCINGVPAGAMQADPQWAKPVFRS